MYTGKSIGLLFMGVDIRSFDSRLYQVGIQKDEKVFILDSNKKILSSSENVEISPELLLEMKPLLENKDKGHASVNNHPQRRWLHL